MKVVLVNTPSLFVYGKIKSGHNCSFPLGLGYIASYIRRAGHEVRLFDPEAHNISYERMWEEVKTFKPDMVGISAVTSNFMEATQLVLEAKEKIGSLVIMGGPHVTALPQTSLLITPGLDAIIIGEGEIPVLSIADYFDKYGRVDFNEIPGVAFFEGNEFKKNRRPPFIENIDVIPYPARDLVDINVYKLHPHFQHKSKSATILSSRGCPSKCTFCGNIVQARRFRPHSPEYFVGELEFLVKQYNIRHFHIVDDCFSYDLSRVEKICDLILSKQLDITWFAFGRVDTLQDERIIKKMKKAGCIYVLLGIETGNQEINNIMRKGTTLEMAKRCCELLSKNNIKYLNSFMIGNDGDTEQTVIETIEFARSLKSVITFFNILIPFPGTFIFKKYFSDYNNPATNWNNWCAVGDDIPYEPRQTVLSKSDILRLTSYAYKRYYFNPKQFLRIILFAGGNPRIFYSCLKGGIGLARQTVSWFIKSIRYRREGESLG